MVRGVDAIIQQVLLQALTQPEARLVARGRHAASSGLFPPPSRRSPTRQQAYEACMSQVPPLLRIVREETVGRSRAAFVRVTQRGLQRVVESAAISRLPDLIQQCSADYRLLLGRMALVRVEGILQQADAQTAASRRVLRPLWAGIETALAADRRQRQQWEKLRASLEAALSEEQAGGKEQAGPRASAAPPESGPRIIQEILLSWEHENDAAARAGLERALHNVGVRRLGAVGDRVPFDGWRHRSEAPVFPEDDVEIITPGWLMSGPGGETVLTPAETRPLGSTIP